ncbi:MAG: cytidyltransferase-related domain protein [Peptococcaceae bacterium]|nr:cytidyltransferase-related domain protein [Peptococcaceae bacterium]
MTMNELQSLAGAMTARLSSSDFLNTTGLTGQGVRAIAGREYWEDIFAEAFPVTRRFTCSEILEYCLAPMHAISETPEEGWMAFTYQFVCTLLYPDSEKEARNQHYAAAALFYLKVLQFFFDEERKVMRPEPFVDLVLLAPEEYEHFESRSEYELFLKYYRDEFVYEMFRLNMEVTDYKTLEHIAGVHYVAMSLARGLYAAGAPIDLALVSGAAAGHDLGKFGCKPGEAVPHMHYYYTNLWFSRHQMRYIGHIAANHSTWDLEPERLSVESLVLIYADFCVKQERVRGENITRITSLKDAFDIILNKLENVDAEKKRRYQFVYSRLKDFHDYMLYLGVDTSLVGKPVFPEKMPAVSLRNLDETVQSLVYMGVETNIAVMHRMAAGRQFGNFLERARSETDQRNLQVYLRLFDRYTAYTNDEQKRQTAAYLYELMMHRDGEVRVEASRLLGKTIAQFNFGYRKRYPRGMKNLDTEQAFVLWNHYIGEILRPDLRLNEVQKLRIQSNSKNVLASVLENATAEDKKDFLHIFLECFADSTRWQPDESFALLNTVFELPPALMDETLYEMIGDYAMDKRESGAYEEQIAAWHAMHWLVKQMPQLAVAERFVAYLETVDTAGDMTRTYLKYKILTDMGRDAEAEASMLFNDDILPDIFLVNLQAATPWIVKAVNIKLLSDQVAHHGEHHRLHIAAHFSNLLKVNDIMAVPREAGQALAQLIPILRIDERNEVMMELVHALEVADARYSRYIPEYLARTLLWLPTTQLDEMITHITALLSSTNAGIVMRALDTIGNMLRFFQDYAGRFDISDEAYCHRRHILFGAILKGIASYNEDVRQEAMQVLSDVFAVEDMSIDEKYLLFTSGCRKMLFLMSEPEKNEISLFARASAVSAVSNFISHWRMDYGNFDLVEWSKVAFVPGTFDPFTASHKEIVRRIRDRGYEVYLAVDEFSWSKKAQPHLIRRKIVNMSVADELHVNIFPYDLPINIANPKDLEKLKEIFAPREVYMVVGSDVIANASSYRGAVEPHSIHNMNHVIIRRGDTPRQELEEATRHIFAKVDIVDLPREFRHISSTMLRENIDLNRDVSNLVDPMVQSYIYDSGLYLREPEDKPLVEGKVLSFEYVAQPSEALLEEIYSSVLQSKESIDEIFEAMRRSNDTLILLRNMLRNNKLTGVIRCCYMAPESLYSVLGDVALADKVRRHTSGEILLISGLYTAKDSEIADPAQLLLTEALAKACGQGCSYAMFFAKEATPSGYVMDAVKRQGFVLAEQIKTKMPVYLVDMCEPVVVLRNLRAFIKEPLVSEPQVIRVIEEGYRELQHAMTALYPGELVLTLASEVIFPRMVEMITEINGVPNEKITPRVLGANMCVPFGRIMRERVIPNTVTKTLHTDTVYQKDLADYTIEAFESYTPLADQVRMIHSFDRPVILVDDIMNQGKRFTTLESLLREEEVPIRKMVFGVLTGLGRDRMAERGIDCDSVYFVPNVRKWYVESSLYPFIGGDTVDREGFNIAEVSPSVNPLMPYTNPDLAGASEEALFNFSARCIENARNIYYILEECYRTRFGRNLTMERIGEVITVASAPDRGECVTYDPNVAASVYLDNDLKMLYRQKK